MATETSSVDPFEFLHIVLNPDGSLTRLDGRPTNPSTQPINETPLGFFKDVALNDENNTSLRLFMPLNQTPQKKLPVIIFFHGGGFILQSATSKSFHDLCLAMAAQLTVVVVSVEYRLAPEHRLPAAYDDAVEALLWVQQQAVGAYVDPWISRYADVSRCFLMGGSAGANIAYNTGLSAVDLELNPMKIVGLILNQPFIGGVERTESELRLMNDPVIPLVVADLMWELALPIGSSRDHVFNNPLRRSPLQNKKIKQLPSCLVRGYEGDPLVDRQREFVKMLKKLKVKVASKFREGGIHAAEVFDLTKIQVLIDDVKTFMSLLETEEGNPEQNDGPRQHYN